MQISQSLSTTPLAGVAGPLALPETGTPDRAVDFQKLLIDSIAATNDLEQTAQTNIEQRLLGGEITSAEVYTSMRKSEMALKMMMQVRNKLVDAYQEIQQMRM